MKRIILASLVLLLGAPAVVAQPPPNQTTYTLTSFPAPPGPGFSYASSLLLASDGNFYGTHNEIVPITVGGHTTYTYTGSVFRVALDGTLTTVATLPAVGPSDNQLGFGPYSGLVQDGNGNFYGTTYVHGATRDTLDGMVYKLAPDGTLTTLHYFTIGSDGSKPHGNLLAGADGNFYGTTSIGGASGKGTVFSITPDGVFTTLYSFTGGSDGANPFAPLVLASDRNFYGTTTAAGANGGGTVFQLTPTGTLTPLFSFAASDGNFPFAGLVQGRDGNFYGRTVNPAPFRGSGTIFKLTPDGTLTTLATFPNGTDDGFSCVALVQGSDGSFYGTFGTTLPGASSPTGGIFTITPDGVLTTLYTFSNLSSGRNADGADPRGSLIQAPDGNFYGTTSIGGAQGTGTVFTIAPRATLTTLSVFDGSAGQLPIALLQGQDGNFYGVTAHSASGAGVGTVFMVPPSGGTPTTLHTFARAEAYRPNNALIQTADGSLYGTASEGGAGGIGTVWKMAVDGTTTVVHSFLGGIDGEIPQGGVILASDGNFYGVATGGGTIGGGTLFQLTPDGTSTTLHSFVGGTDGANPVAALLQASDGNFYGTTSRAGFADGRQVGGTAFQFTGVGNPVVLHAFDGNIEGPTPVTTLVEAPDGLLWGTTASQYQPSMIFRISKDGSAYAKVHAFTNSEGGNSVASLLLASDGYFYGILDPNGSTVAGAGIIFKISRTGIFLVVHRFSGPDGAGPYYGALVEGVDGFLYGVTGSGGGPTGSGRGTFFRLDRGRLWRDSRHGRGAENAKPAKWMAGGPAAARR